MRGALGGQQLQTDTGGESRGAGRVAAGGIGETSREVEAAGRGEGNSR